MTIPQTLSKAQSTTIPSVFNREKIIAQTISDIQNEAQLFILQYNKKLAKQTTSVPESVMYCLYCYIEKCISIMHTLEDEDKKNMQLYILDVQHYLSSPSEANKQKVYKHLDKTGYFPEQNKLVVSGIKDLIKLQETQKKVIRKIDEIETKKKSLLTINDALKQELQQLEDQQQEIIKQIDQLKLKIKSLQVSQFSNLVNPTILKEYTDKIIGDISQTELNDQESQESVAKFIVLFGAILKQFQYSSLNDFLSQATSKNHPKTLFFKLCTLHQVLDKKTQTCNSAFTKSIGSDKLYKNLITKCQLTVMKSLKNPNKTHTKKNREKIFEIIKNMLQQFQLDIEYSNYNEIQNLILHALIISILDNDKNNTQQIINNLNQILFQSDITSTEIVVLQKMADFLKNSILNN